MATRRKTQDETTRPTPVSPFGVEQPTSPTCYGFLSRERAAELIGVHVNTLMKWESTGVVQSTIGPGGRHMFDKMQIEEIRRQKRPDQAPNFIDTDTAVAVFKCFEQHMVPNQVVTSAGVHPDLVERLREQWDRMRAKDRLLAEYSDQIRRQGEALQQLTADIGKRLTSMSETMVTVVERVRRLESTPRLESTQQPTPPASPPRPSRKPEPEDNTEELLRHIAAAKALMAASEAEEAARTAGATETAETAGVVAGSAVTGAVAGAGAGPTPA